MQIAKFHRSKFMAISMAVSAVLLLSFFQNCGLGTNLVAVGNYASSSSDLSDADGEAIKNYKPTGWDTRRPDSMIIQENILASGGLGRQEVSYARMHAILQKQKLRMSQKGIVLQRKVQDEINNYSIEILDHSAKSFVANSQKVVPPNKLNIVIVAEGFKNKRDFDLVANSYTAAMAETKPFTEYFSLFNIHKVFLQSEDDEISFIDSQQGIFKDRSTPLGATYVDGLMGVDFTHVGQLVSKAVPNWDYILIVFNPPIENKMNGALGIAYWEEGIAMAPSYHNPTPTGQKCTNCPPVPVVFLHEFGHLFGLCDEVRNVTATNRAFFCPNEAPKGTSRSNLPWAPLLDITDNDLRSKVGSYVVPDGSSEDYILPNPFSRNQGPWDTSSIMNRGATPYFGVVNTEVIVSSLFSLNGKTGVFEHREIQRHKIPAIPMLGDVQIIPGTGNDFRIKISTSNARFKTKWISNETLPDQRILAQNVNEISLNQMLSVLGPSERFSLSLVLEEDAPFKIRTEWQEKHLQQKAKVLVTKNTTTGKYSLCLPDGAPLYGDCQNLGPINADATGTFTGSLAAGTVRINIVPAADHAAGPICVFFAVQFQGQNYFNVNGNWIAFNSSPSVENNSYCRTVGPQDSKAFVLVNGMNLVPFVGAEIYAGYGIGNQPFDEMLAAQRYKSVGVIRPHFPAR